jgi:hypothetical protein
VKNRIYFFEAKNSRLIVALLFVLLLFRHSTAQVYPIRSTVILTPPYSPYLSDYTAPGSQRFMIQLTPNDITSGDHLIKLRFTIEGVGITIRTKQNFVPKPLTLYGGGSPTTFYGEDISEYFHPNNLDFAGYSRTEFTKTGKLPEGIYRFSVEVLSYNRDVPLSNRGSAMAWIILNDPPLLNLPRKDTKIKILDPTSIPFTWTPRHTGSPNSAFSTEYIFKLVEIWPENRNPNDAFLSQRALYEETTTQTQFVYGPEHPALIPGRKYAWSVQARDIEGKDLFKNHGKSEVFVFQFGDALNPPENIKQNKSNNATVIDLSWDPPLSGAMPQTYRVRYRKKGSGNIQPWYEGLADQRWIALTELQTDTEYELQMRSEGNSQVSEYSMLQFMKTGSQGTLPYECGKQDVVSIDTAATPLLKLAVGETITAAGFKILVSEVESKNGTFTGQGWMAVPMFNGASVKVQFTNIRVNEKFQLTAGEFVTTYSKGSKIERLVDQAHKIGEEKTEKPSAQEILSDSISSMPITLLVVIDTLYAIGDKIVIVDESGGESTYKRTVDKEGKFQPVIIVDGSGTQYTVNEDGSVSGGSSGANQLNQVNRNAIKEQLLRLILADFKIEINTWLANHGKGPLDDETIAFIMALPECFPEDAEVLEHLNENIIPYYDNDANIAQLRTAIEANQPGRELLDEIARQFHSLDQVSILSLNQEDRDNIRNTVCDALVEVVNNETISTEVRSNGSVIAAASYILISAEPAMPALSIKAVSSVQNSATEASFRLKIEYRRDIRQDEDFFPATGWKKIRVNQTWNVDFGDNIRGGRATLYCDYGATKDTVVFYIRGTNPTEQAVKDYLTAQSYDVWFLTRMIRQESNYRHFNAGTNYGTGWNDSQGCPNFGPPHGWGLMQLDLLNGGQRPTAQQLWSWKANVDRGYQFLNGEKRNMVNNRLNAAVTILNSWYKENQEDTVQGHADQVEGLITYTHANSTHFDLDFGAEVSGQSKPFADASWIKNYNGSSGGTDGYPGFYYLVKQLPDIDNNKPFWSVQRVNSGGHNYVEAVSNRAE